MPAKPKIPQDEKDFIAEEVLKASRDADRGKLAIQLLNYIKRAKSIGNRSWWVEPSEDTLKTMISKNRALLLQSMRYKTLGNPGQWTLGTYTDEVPIAKLPEVIRIWQLCQLHGEPFTTQDAKWVARLSELIEDASVLKQWAKFYSNQEYFSNVLGRQEFDTSEYDKLLIMEPWERITSIIVGKYQLPEGYYHWRDGAIKRIDMLPICLDKSKSYVDYTWLLGKALETDTRFFAKGLFWDYIDGKEVRLDYGINEPTLKDEEIESSGFVPIRDIGLSSDALKVYTLWVEKLTEGEYVSKMTALERIEVLNDLRKWIQSHPFASDTSSQVTSAKDGVLNITWFLNEADIEKLVVRLNLFPNEIVEKVGMPDD